MFAISRYTCIFVSTKTNNMTTIAKEKTFAFQEKQLLNAGFTCEILDRNISRFKGNNQYAFIMYVGNGEGFKTEFYDTIAKD